MARSTKANAKERVSVFLNNTLHEYWPEQTLMQKHARASKIAHIFQTRDERRVRREAGREGRTEYFLFQAWRASSSLSGALEEHCNARGTDNGSCADAHYDDWQIQLTAGRAPPRQGRPA